MQISPHALDPAGLPKRYDGAEEVIEDGGKVILCFGFRVRV